MAELSISGLVKRYGDFHAVRDVSLDIADGEFLVLLGPSGCGKTTTLRMVAGFIEPTAGHVKLGGNDVTLLPPWKRNAGMVFQSYALFPHLSVAQNVAFGLEMRKVAKAETAKRVDEALALVRLGGLGGRLPRQLSGGQQQRVALARAIVHAANLGAGVDSLLADASLPAVPVARVVHPGSVTDVLHAPGLGRVLWFTVWQAVLSTVLTLVVGFAPAYVLARYRFAGRRAVLAETGVGHCHASAFTLALNDEPRVQVDRQRHRLADRHGCRVTAVQPQRRDVQLESEWPHQCRCG